MKIVSDAGPILSFSRGGRLEILRQVVGELIVPQAVVEELDPSFTHVELAKTTRGEVSKDLPKEVLEEIKRFGAVE